MFHPRRGLRAKIHNGEVLLGMFARTASADMIEIAGFNGLDFVIIDMEHGPIDGSGTRDLVRAAECGGISPLVRPYKNDPALILRALDVGAIGIVIPHVRDADDARLAVSSVKYFPDGNRGVCPSIRATEFDSRFTDADNTWDTYKSVANDETVVMVLIEDMEGIKNLESIVQVPGIDAISIGQTDLSIALGLPRDDPKIREICKDAIELSRRHGVAVHASLRKNDPEMLAYWHGLGCTMFHYTEVLLFSDAVATAVHDARNTLAQALPAGE